MAHRIRRLIPVFFIGIALVALGQTSSVSAHAESVQNKAITLSPASTEIAVDPGATTTKSMDIINSGSDAFGVEISSSPYYVSGLDYDPHFTQLPGTVDASAWVHLSNTKANVAGNGTLSVPYTVTVPQGTPPGGYYAVLFAETSSDESKNGVVSHNRVGDILYITVNGTIKSGGKITGSSLPKIGFIGSIPITTKISNTGGVHFVTKAVYTITDMTGKQVYSATTERYVLPQTERQITSSWTPQALFGIFTIHRSATIAGNQQTLPDEKIIIINPWVFVIVAFLLGVLIGVPYQRARQRRRSNKK